MGLRRTGLALPAPLTITRTHPDDEAVLRRVAGSASLTLSNLELWRSRSSDARERASLDRVYAAQFGQAFTAGDLEVNQTSVDPVSSETGKVLSSKRVIDGELDELADMRQRMPDGLWGQEHVLDAFLHARADALSTTRRTPSLLVMAGGTGQGKTEAFEAYKILLAKPDASDPEKLDEPKVVSVDLRTVTDGQLPQLMGDDGELNHNKLLEAAKTQNVLVLLRNPANLALNAPKVAKALNDQFQDESDGNKAIHYLVDFDNVPDAHAAFGQAFGSPGVRQASAFANFGQLGAETMLRYADQLLPLLLQGTRVEGVKLIFEPETRKLLGEVLATPHEPLDDLQSRLQQFVLSHVHVQTSFDPEKSSLRFELEPTLRADPAKLRALIDELHQPLADLSAGRTLFVASEVARDRRLQEGEVDVQWSMASDALARLRSGWSEDSTVKALARLMTAMTVQTDSARNFGWYDLVTDRQFQTFRDLVEVLASDLELESQLQGEHVVDAGLALLALDQAITALAQTEEAPLLEGSPLAQWLEEQDKAGTT